jgi:hypothetical protein
LDTKYIMSLSDVGSILGMILGTAGFVLGVMNYLRDKPQIKVRFAWDYELVSSGTRSQNKLYGLVTVTNCGRRPVFITSVSIPLPKKIGGKSLLLLQSIQGKKLDEGDGPAQFMIDQDSVDKKCALYWKSMRVVVTDSLGKKYKSNRIKKEPSWAESTD